MLALAATWLVLDVALCKVIPDRLALDFANHTNLFCAI